MEKYGVVIDDTKTKTASKTSTCPVCGRALEASFPKCSSCGTKPFEVEKDEGKDKTSRE